MRVTTWPALRIRYSNSRNSRGSTSIGLARTLDGAGQQIELEIRDPQLRRSRRPGAAAQQRLQTGEQLAEGEGLDQVIVAAGAQTLDAVIDAAERAEDQRRGADFGRAQRAQNRQTVHARQHAVENDGVVVPGTREKQSFAPVIRTVDRVAALVQTLGQVSGGFAIVFDDEDLHLDR